jgi:hypothetical protein
LPTRPVITTVPEDGDLLIGGAFGIKRVIG